MNYLKYYRTFAVILLLALMMVFSPGSTRAEELVLDEDGEWRVYSKDTLQTDYTGIISYGGGQFHIISGTKTHVSGLILSGGEWYFLSDGQIQDTYIGFAEYDGQWFYIQYGKLDVNANGLFLYDGKRFLVAAGRVLVEVNGVGTAYNGLWQDFDGTWYFLANGQVKDEFSGITVYDGHHFKVLDGKLDNEFSGIVDYEGKKFNVIFGQLYDEVIPTTAPTVVPTPLPTATPIQIPHSLIPVYAGVVNEIQSIDGLTFQIGSSGTGVKDLQSILISIGFLQANKPDGVFGNKTKEAIEDFQTAAGLQVTGKADLYTQFMLIMTDGVYSQKGDCHITKAGYYIAAVWPDRAFFIGRVDQNGNYIEGTYYYTGGDYYIGEYNKNLRSGYGTAHFSNGDIYIGQWENDAMNGTGVYYFGGLYSGEYYEGNMSNNTMDGNGSYHLNGMVITGKWSSNKHISWQ